MHAPLVDSSLWLALGWTMLHFLWVGASLGALTWLGRLMLREAGPRFRYALSLAGLAAMVAAPVGIGVVVYEPPPPIEPSAAPPGHSAQAMSARIGAEPMPIVAAGPWGSIEKPAVLRELPPGPAERATLSAETMVASLVSVLPWIWLIGTPATLIAITVGLAGSERLRRLSQPITDGALLERHHRLIASVGIARSVGLGVCDRLSGPILIGIVRPMILLPPAALTGWTPDQIEMVLIHELAHVRRWDNLVNLLQRLIEALLFFHPAVWLVSRWARVDREECCDQVVLRQTNRPRAYAELLAMFALGQGPGAAAGVAMSRHPVLVRVGRVLGLRQSAQSVSRRAVVVIASGLIATCLLFAARAQQPLASDEAQQKTVEKTERRVSDKASSAPVADGASVRTESTRKVHAVSISKAAHGKTAGRYVLDQEIPVGIVLGTDDLPRIAEVVSIRFSEDETYRYAEARTVVERPVQGRLMLMLDVRSENRLLACARSATVDLAGLSSSDSHPIEHVFKLWLVDGPASRVWGDQPDAKDLRRKAETYDLHAHLSPWPGPNSRPVDVLRESTDVASLEVLAVGRPNGEGIEWWRPDGRPTTFVPRLRPPRRYRVDPDFVQTYWVLLRLDGRPWDACVMASDDLAGVPSGEPAKDPNGRSIPNLWIATLRLAADQREISLGYSLGVGPWKTIVRHRATLWPVNITVPEGWCRISEVIPDPKRPGRTIVKAVCRSSWDVRAIAVDRSGNEHEPLRQPHYIGCGWGAHWSHHLVFDLPIDDVALIRFQQRVRKHFEFAGISLRPGQITQLRIVDRDSGKRPRKAEATRPQAAPLRKPTPVISVVSLEDPNRPRISQATGDHSVEVAFELDTEIPISLFAGTHTHARLWHATAIRFTQGDGRLYASLSATWYSLMKKGWQFSLALKDDDAEVLGRAERTIETQQITEGGLSKRYERRLGFAFGSDVPIDRVTRFEIRILPINDESQAYLPEYGKGKPRGRGGLRTMLANSGGRRWLYCVYLPEQYDAQLKRGIKTPRHLTTKSGRWPLVVTFSGAQPFDRPNFQISEWHQEADRYGFLVVAPKVPQGVVPLDSRVLVESQSKDLRLSYVNKMAEDTIGIVRGIIGRYPVDAEHVLATGWFTGGCVAHYIANRDPDLFTCLAVRQAPFWADLLDPAKAKRCAKMPIGVFWAEKDFSVCDAGSRQAIEWYRTHGFDDVSWGVFSQDGHERVPQVAAAFFAIHCGIGPRVPARFPKLVQGQGRIRAVIAHASLRSDR